MAKKKITKTQRDAFFKSLSGNGVVSAACYASLLSRSWVEKQRELDDEWARDWQEAIEASKDTIRAEIYRRAVTGVTRIAFGANGIIIGPPKPGEDKGSPLEVTEWSDKLLEFQARAIIPEYSDWAQTVIPPLAEDMQPHPKPTPDDPDAPEPIE